MATTSYCYRRRLLFHHVNIWSSYMPLLAITPFILHYIHRHHIIAIVINMLLLRHTYYFIYQHITLVVADTLFCLFIIHYCRCYIITILIIAAFTPPWCYALYTINLRHCHHLVVYRWRELAGCWHTPPGFHCYICYDIYCRFTIRRLHYILLFIYYLAIIVTLPAATYYYILLLILGYFYALI